MIVAKLYYNIKFWYKLKFNKPIYRVDVLRAVKYNYGNNRQYGICFSILTIINLCKLRVFLVYNSLSDLFPKLTSDYAKRIVGTNPDSLFWWKRHDWTGDRMKFLNWLIKEYKNDKEEIKRIKYCNYE